MKSMRSWSSRSDGNWSETGLFSYRGPTVPGLVGLHLIQVELVGTAHHGPLQVQRLRTLKQGRKKRGRGRLRNSCQQLVAFRQDNASGSMSFVGPAVCVRDGVNAFMCALPRMRLRCGDRLHAEHMESNWVRLWLGGWLWLGGRGWPWLGRMSSCNAGAGRGWRSGWPAPLVIVIIWIAHFPTLWQIPLDCTNASTCCRVIVICLT